MRSADPDIHDENDQTLSLLSLLSVFTLKKNYFNDCIFYSLIVLALRGQVNPATSIFFVPDSDGWVYYPAVMDDPSMDLQPSLTRRNIRFFLWTR